MKILYTRVSTQDQNPSRQLLDKNYDYTLTDFCSGSLPLYMRPKGSQIKKLIDEGALTELHIHSIDRLGRNTLDVLNVWEDLTKKGIVIVCKNPSIRNITEDGAIDRFSELTMQILSMMASFTKSLIKDSQMEGIRLRQAKGLYMGRKINSKETPEKFLEKEKSQKILSYLKKGTYTAKEVASILDISTTTITKTRKVAKEFGML